MDENVLYIINEVVGYVGMGFVVLSFAMKNIKALRILNIIGALLCATYGFISKTYPTAVLNVLLVSINIFFPIRFIIRQKKIKNEESEDKK